MIKYVYIRSQCTGFFFQEQTITSLYILDKHKLKLKFQHIQMYEFFFLFCAFSFGHCIVCPPSSGYPFGIFWSLYCLSFFDIRFLITPMVSFGHCVVCHSSTYGFWLPLWYHLTIVLSVLLRHTASNYSFHIIWPLCCLSFFDIRFLVTLWYHLAIVLSVLLRNTTSNYSFHIIWPLCCLSFFDTRFLVTSFISFGYCVVCHSSVSGYPFWYLQAFRTFIL